MRHVGLHATIMDIVELTLEVIQQYVGMNTWENVIAFAGVFDKAIRDITKFKQNNYSRQARHEFQQLFPFSKLPTPEAFYRA